ncbi:hypothetical protein [Azospirillum sp. SYSU D00513]|uniref:hypothetical protein n=1 Tax=Azospirillum sp. SYSU D00513 TaxID=2812561 RepID=UPI001A96D278|nr:hypothetical protein [Azospirillum sp. SYSU D00513]
MPIAQVGNIEIVVKTRGEHCPPHVHADCDAEGWSARFKFYFESDDVDFWDLRPRNARKAPQASVLDEVGEAVYRNLVQVRKRWWEVMGTVCLSNQYVHCRAGKIIVLERFEKGALQILEAAYEPSRKTLRVGLSDGSIYEQLL